MHRNTLLFGVIAFLIPAGCVSSSKYQKDMAACTDEKALCIREKTTLEGQVDALNKEKTDLAAQTQSKEAEINQLKGTYDQLVGSLKSEISNGEIQVTQLKDQLRLNMVEKILFDSGSTKIKETGKKVLDQIAQALNKVADKDIRVEGFTDNVPVGSKLRERYPTNWELSTTRATNVVRYLQEKGNVDPGRLIAAGYGEFHPTAPNDTPEGQAQNRRIDVVLVAPEIAAPAAKITSQQQPATTPATATTPTDLSTSTASIPAPIAPIQPPPNTP